MGAQLAREDFSGGTINGDPVLAGLQGQATDLHQTRLLINVQG